MKTFRIILVAVLMLVYGVRTSGALVQDSVSQAPQVSKWIAPPKDKIYFVGGGVLIEFRRSSDNN